MEQAVREYADWAAEEEPAGGEDPVAELLRARADEARSPVQTWLMPVVEDMERCIRERFFPRILQEMNTRLVNGDLSLLLGRAVVSERIAPRDLEIGGVSCWRLNRTDFLADVDLTAALTVEQDSHDTVFTFCVPANCTARIRLPDGSEYSRGAGTHTFRLPGSYNIAARGAADGV